MRLRWVAKDQSGPVWTAECIWPECRRNAWSRTQEGLTQFLKAAGYANTPRGWVCPTHVEEARIVSDLINRIP